MAIEKLKIPKLPGTDQIPAELIKAGGRTIFSEIHYLINCIRNKFQYLRTTLPNQNSIQEEIKSKSKAENSCYNSVQNLLFSSLLFKNIKIKIQETVIFRVVSYVCETWLLTFPEECRLRLLENRVLRRIFGPKRMK